MLLLALLQLLCPLRLAYTHILLELTNSGVVFLQKVLHDDDLHKEVLEIVEKKVEDLQERGVETVPEKDLLIMRKKLQLIDNRFDHYKKPQGRYLS